MLLKIFYITIIVIFTYLNYQITISDIRNKKIPNKYLGYLLLLIPLWWAVLFLGLTPHYLLGFSEINPIFFSLQVILTFIISFVLYYFGIWAAGDAKYLLVLSLFIPYIGIVPFIGNIALITIIYLLGYFIYFYVGKVLFNKQYRKSLFTNIKKDLSETWLVYKGKKGGNAYQIAGKFLLVFFVIFVSIRLARIYLFNSFFKNGNNVDIFSKIIEEYSIYITCSFLALFIGGMYLFRILLNKMKNYISNTFQVNLVLIGNVSLGILTIFLLSFISYELANDFDVIIKLLIRIFTLYLGIYLVVKALIYSYKITFGIGEVYYKDINNLVEGDIIDRKYLIQLFGNEVIEINKKVQGKIPDFKVYLKVMSSTIDRDGIKLLNKLDENKKQIPIKLLNTFSFGLYLFLGFVLTFALEGKIFNYIINFFINVFKTTH